MCYPLYLPLHDRVLPVCDVTANIVDGLSGLICIMTVSLSLASHDTSGSADSAAGSLLVHGSQPDCPVGLSKEQSWSVQPSTASINCIVFIVGRLAGAGQRFSLMLTAERRLLTGMNFFALTLISGSTLDETGGIGSSFAVCFDCSEGIMLAVLGADDGSETD